MADGFLHVPSTRQGFSSQGPSSHDLSLRLYRPTRNNVVSGGFPRLLQ
uniref:Uncharacterized protein n=1 Tax=Zea mays TaxID=4577 RepID=B4G278_MAIZE|nr:unknown [Zea mays]